MELNLRSSQLLDDVISCCVFVVCAFFRSDYQFDFGLCEYKTYRSMRTFLKKTDFSGIFPRTRRNFFNFWSVILYLLDFSQYRDEWCKNLNQNEEKTTKKNNKVTNKFGQRGLALLSVRLLNYVMSLCLCVCAFLRLDYRFDCQIRLSLCVSVFVVRTYSTFLSVVWRCHVFVSLWFVLF